MTNFKLVATSAMGLEALVADEVKALGYETTTENGKIYFEGDERAIARANLWLRVADRVKIVAAQFPVRTFDQLFEGTKAVQWERYLPIDAAIPVQGKSVKSTLFSVPDCQAIVKKAIVERLKLAHKRIGFLDESGATYKVEISILKDIATITIDTSGAGLHKRGYRQNQGEAPLKETLAAALVKISKWNPNRPFVDPFCGSGTIAIEAAMIGQNIAPGYNRDFHSEAWSWMPKTIWDDVRSEADDLAKYDQKLQIFGSDNDPKMIQIAEQNSFESGFSDIISFEHREARDFITDLTDGVMIGNPPYGERIGEVEIIEQTISELGHVMRQYPTWSVYMLSSMENFEEVYGRRTTKKRKLFNGFIRTDYYQYWGKRS